MPPKTAYKIQPDARFHKKLLSENDSKKAVCFMIASSTASPSVNSSSGLPMPVSRQVRTAQTHGRNRITQLALPVYPRATPAAMPTKASSSKWVLYRRRSFCRILPSSGAGSSGMAGSSVPCHRARQAGQTAMCACTSASLSGLATPSCTSGIRSRQTAQGIFAVSAALFTGRSPPLQAFVLTRCGCGARSRGPSFR